MISAIRDRFKGSEPPALREAWRARLLGTAHQWTATLLLAAILGMANYLAFRHYKRWDWTEDKRFTLSDRTVKLLKSLRRRVDVYLFLSANEQNAGDVHEVLARYEAQSTRVRVHSIDLDRKPAEYRRLAQKFDIGLLRDADSVAPEVALVVASGKKTWKVTRDDLFEISTEYGQGEQRPNARVKTERAISGAILQVTSGRPTHTCLTQGHGEWQLSGEGERTLQVLYDELRRENFEVETVETLASGEVKGSCDAVFVIGPRRAFLEEEARSLIRYLERGGNILLAVDPVVEAGRVQPTGLETLGMEAGIEIDPSIVFERDPARLMPSNPIATFFVVSDYKPHRTSQALLSKGGGRSVFLEARSVYPREGSRATTLLETSEKGFAKTDLSAIETEGAVEPAATDRKGLVSFAVAASGLGTKKAKGEKNPKGGRIVVVGDSDWLASVFTGNPGAWANLDLASAWIGWLTEREALISIAPRKVNLAAVHVTEEDLTSLLFRLLLLLPGTAALVGLGVWWRRRS